MGENIDFFFRQMLMSLVKTSNMAAVLCDRKSSTQQQRVSAEVPGYFGVALDVTSLCTFATGVSHLSVLEQVLVLLFLPFYMCFTVSLGSFLPIPTKKRV